MGRGRPAAFADRGCAGTLGRSSSSPVCRRSTPAAAVARRSVARRRPAHPCHSTPPAQLWRHSADQAGPSPARHQRHRPGSRNPLFFHCPGRRGADGGELPHGTVTLSFVDSAASPRLLGWLLMVSRTCCADSAASAGLAAGGLVDMPSASCHPRRCSSTPSWFRASRATTRSPSNAGSPRAAAAMRHPRLRRPGPSPRSTTQGSGQRYTRRRLLHVRHRGRNRMSGPPTWLMQPRQWSCPAQMICQLRWSSLKLAASGLCRVRGRCFTLACSRADSSPAERGCCCVAAPGMPCGKLGQAGPRQACHGAVCGRTECFLFPPPLLYGRGGTVQCGQVGGAAGVLRSTVCHGQGCLAAPHLLSCNGPPCGPLLMCRHFCTCSCCQVVADSRIPTIDRCVLQALLGRGLHHLGGCTFRQLPVLLTHVGDELLKVGLLRCSAGAGDHVWVWLSSHVDGSAMGCAGEHGALLTIGVLHVHIRSWL